VSTTALVIVVATFTATAILLVWIIRADRRPEVGARTSGVARANSLQSASEALRQAVEAGERAKGVSPQKSEQLAAPSGSRRASVNAMRMIIILFAISALFILSAMFVAPYVPEVRSWYVQNACPHLDKVSPDICAAARREERS
jgi:hypothetical protein